MAPLRKRKLVTHYEECKRRKPYERSKLRRNCDHIKQEWEIEDFFNLAADDVTYIVGPSFSFSQCLFELSLLRKYRKNRDRHTAFELHMALLDGNESSVVVHCDTALIKVNDRKKPLQSIKCLFENCKEIYDNFEHSLKGLRPSVKIGEIRVMEVLKKRDQLAPHDLLTIALSVKIDSFTFPHEANLDTSSTIVFKDYLTLARNFESLYENEWNSDITLKVMDREFNVHRSVLVARSPIFKAMFVPDTTEKQTSINIADCIPDIFEKLLIYLYTGRVHNISPGTALELIKAARKYAVPELEKFVIYYLIETLSIGNVCDVLLVADKFKVKKLSAAILSYFTKNCATIVKTEGWKDFCELYQPVVKELSAKLSSRGISI